MEVRPVLEDLKIILLGNNNEIRSYVTSTHYFKSLNETIDFKQ